MNFRDLINIERLRQDIERVKNLFRKKSEEKTEKKPTELVEYNIPSEDEKNKGENVG